MMDKKINLNKGVFEKNQYQKVIDTSFTQLVQPVITGSTPSPSISIPEFFNTYQQLFFDIPKFGDINSHEYLIKTSQEYAGEFNNNEDLIEALIEEVTELREENFILQQQLINSTGSL